MSGRVWLCPADATGVSLQTMEASVEPADKQSGPAEPRRSSDISRCAFWKQRRQQERYVDREAWAQTWR